MLQAALDLLCNWADKWEMRFNVDKCHLLHLGRNNQKHSYNMNGNMLESTDKEKDIGVIISNNLKPAAHCEKVARTASGVLHQILRSFISYRDRSTLPHIFQQYVRPHLEFAAKGRHRPAGKCPEKNGERSDRPTGGQYLRGKIGGVGHGNS